MIEFEDKEKSGIKTDCQVLCLDAFENSDATYKKIIKSVLEGK